MPTGANLLENNALAALSRQASPSVVGAIQKASTTTGVDFAYLMRQAATESSFRPDAKAATSSATGLYQFIESTWMDMVQKHGPKYGISAANQDKQSLLKLREDPKLASVMAAELAKDNKAYLQNHVGGDIGPTELYMAHFMGAGGAAGFLKAMQSNPLQTGADLFPKEARANTNIFYDSKSGRARSLGEIYDRFDQKFKGDDALPTQDAPTRKASPSHHTYASAYNYNTFQDSTIRNFLSMMLFEDLPRSSILDQQNALSSFSVTSLYHDLIVNPVDMLNMKDS